MLRAMSDRSTISKAQRAEIGAEKARSFVSRNWRLAKEKCNSSGKDSREGMSFEEILERLKRFNFSISGMAFQDAYDIDLDRLKDCCIHVVSDKGYMIPFCAYNLTDTEGNYLYRGKI